MPSFPLPSCRQLRDSQFSCCGYFNASDLIAIGGNFCTSQEKADQLNTTVLKNFCVTPVTAYSDVSLNDVFTCVPFRLSSHLSP